MSGKSAKRRREKSGASGRPELAPVAPGGAGVAAGEGAAAEVSSNSWLDSPDPRKRKLGQVVLAIVWLYVAALWLLALDQTFHWGLFGPAAPPLP